MKRCRTDVSNAWHSADWVRIPYPFQWGPPTFHFKTVIIMIFASLVASVDSVSFHLFKSIEFHSVTCFSTELKTEGTCCVICIIFLETILNISMMTYRGAASLACSVIFYYS
jgi:Permease family